MVMELQQQITPLSYGAAQNLAEYYIQARRFDDARATLEISESRSPVVEPGVIKRRFFIALSEGNMDAAHKYLAEFAELRPTTSPMVQDLLSALESGPDKLLSILHRYPDQADDMPGQWRVIIASLATHYGDPELAVAVLADEFSRSTFRIRRAWYPFFGDMRKTQEFNDLVVDLGLERFYREYSWPDYCRPLGDDDFECF